MTDKVPKTITQKALMQELQLLNSACHLILVEICMKIHEDSLKAFQVVERTRFGDGRSSMGNNSKSINARVMVLALCMSFLNAGCYLYEVSLC